MSLVGTRPPTVDEWEQYELHHRSRMSIKPGITGMWQASGRSDITDFEEVVKLDTEYIEKPVVMLLYLMSPLTLGEYAEYIASLANLKVRYEIENNESVSKATFALLDTHKIKNIGWKPQYSVKDGLKRTYMIKKEQLTNVD